MTDLITAWPASPIKLALGVFVDASLKCAPHQSQFVSVSISGQGYLLQVPKGFT
jgi:hypothetical protein